MSNSELSIDVSSIAEQALDSSTQESAINRILDLVKKSDTRLKNFFQFLEPDYLKLDDLHFQLQLNHTYAQLRNNVLCSNISFADNRLVTGLNASRLTSLCRIALRSWQDHESAISLLVCSRVKFPLRVTTLDSSSALLGLNLQSTSCIGEATNSFSVFEINFTTGSLSLHLGAGFVERFPTSLLLCVQENILTMLLGFQMNSEFKDYAADWSFVVIAALTRQVQTHCLQLAARYPHLTTSPFCINPGVFANAHSGYLQSFLSSVSQTLRAAAGEARTHLRLTLLGSAWDEILCIEAVDATSEWRNTCMSVLLSMYSREAPSMLPDVFPTAVDVLTTIEGESGKQRSGGLSLPDAMNAARRSGLGHPLLLLRLLIVKLLTCMSQNTASPYVTLLFSRFCSVCRWYLAPQSESNRLGADEEGKVLAKLALALLLQSAATTTLRDQRAPANALDGIRTVFFRFLSDQMTSTPFRELLSCIPDAYQSIEDLVAFYLK